MGGASIDRTTDRGDPSVADPWRAAIRARHRCPEAPLALALVDEIRSSYRHDAVAARARPLVEAQRLHAQSGFGIERFLEEYRLSSEEGIRLLCLAEALLRIRDDETADALIRDKIGGGDWAAHAGHSDSAWVNASTAALRVARRLIETDQQDGVVAGLLARGGEPALRTVVKVVMRLLGEQFVFGTTIEQALGRAKRQAGWRHSFDMLGEAARTDVDARRYLEAYRHAIRDLRIDLRRCRRAGASVRIDQAFGAASALRRGPARPGDVRAWRPLGRAVLRGETRWHRHRAGCRRVRAPRTLARPDQARHPLHGTCAAGAASVWRCRPTRKARDRSSPGWSISRRSSTPC